MDKNEIKNLINKENPVIFEIGCADGIDTLDFLSVFENKLTMYCFEPDDRNANIFVNGGYRPINPNLSQGIKQSNVIFENKAIGDTNGFVEFHQSSTIYSSSLKKPTDNLFKTWDFIKFDNILKIESITLDKYVSNKNIDIIDFIWADVQGAEDLMINGGKKTFDNKVRFLYTEYAQNSNQVYYETSPNREIILQLLGENWEVIKDFGSDILLRNKNL
jgi:2-O-methyltransferase